MIAMHKDTSRANKWRSERNIFSEFFTNNAIPITDHEVAISFVRIQSSPYFHLLVQIIP
jgi:hypothetical protein